MLRISSTTTTKTGCTMALRLFFQVQKLLLLQVLVVAVVVVPIIQLSCPASTSSSSSTFVVVQAFSLQDPMPRPMKVLVTGAAGKTGRLVMKRLEQDPRFDPKALVRTEKSARQLIRGEIKCPLEHMVVSDVTSPTLLEDDFLVPTKQQFLLGGMDAMIICTSAVPRISRRSLLGAIIKVPWNVLVKRQSPIDFKSLQFKWKYGGYPEKVDYHGQVAQIELAKKLGMKHVVVVSSMGGTNPHNFLNKVGKNKDGTGHGDILLWKRKAEMHLIESGLNYTIIHPGGLLDTPGGVEEYVLDVDDKLGYKYSSTRISRDDVAALCVAALSVANGQNVSFDCITRPIEEISSSTTTTTTNSQSSSPQKPKTAEQALSEFLEQSKTANYYAKR